MVNPDFIRSKKIILFLVFMITATMFLISTTAVLQTTTPSPVVVKDNVFVTSDGLKKLIDNDEKTLVIDIRSTDEYEQGHIPNAKSLPLTRVICGSCIQKTLADYKTTRIILYGDNPVEVEVARLKLLNNSFMFVQTLEENFSNWVEKGYPVETSDFEENNGFENPCSYGYWVMTDMPPMSPEVKKPERPKYSNSNDFDDNPDYFSWADQDDGDYTTPVKNQDGCGSCWDFAAVAGLEAVINIMYENPDLDLDLSEQYVLSCLPAAGSCSGGWSEQAYHYIKSNSSDGNNVNGIIPEWCMPYEADDTVSCSDKCENWTEHLWEIKDYGSWDLNGDDPNDQDFLKSKLIEKGPLAIYMTVTNDFKSWGNSHHDPDDYYSDPGPVGPINHAVSLVGYKDDSNITNGGYWICKNSWGTGFGYGGFFNIEYGALRVGDNAIWVSVPEPEFMADFTWIPEYPNTNKPIQFIDQSNGYVTGREWDFGDGIHSSEINPVHTYTQEGNYTVTLIIHGAGKADSETKEICIKNNWAPVAVAKPEYYGGANPTVNFDSSDSWDPDGTITGYHWDFKDGYTSDEMSPVHTYDEDGIYNVALTVTDDKGAWSTDECDIRIDMHTPPCTTVQLAGKLGNNSWFQSSVEIRLVATDWTGVEYTKYRVDDGNWKTYHDPLRIYSDGVHSLEYYSEDVNGNIEKINTTTFKIDTEKPALKINITGEKNQGWYVTPVYVNCSAKDDISHINNIYYRIEKQNMTTKWETYKETLILSDDGEYTLRVFAEDIAGNTMGKTQPYVLNIDTKPPETTYVLTGEGENSIYYKNVTITLNATDHGTGVNNTYYKIFDKWEIYKKPFKVSSVGNHTVEFYSKDNIGHEEKTQKITFKITNLNFNMEITKPQKGLYLFNKKFLNTEKTIIIGDIDIEVSLKPYDDMKPQFDYLEFYIDEKLVAKIDTPPYQYHWTSSAFGNKNIKVKIFNENETLTRTIEAIVFKI